MVVTLLGIVKDVRQLKPEKAELPIMGTLLGKVVFLHPLKSVFEEVSIIALQLSRES